MPVPGRCRSCEHHEQRPSCLLRGRRRLLGERPVRPQLCVSLGQRHYGPPTRVTTRVARTGRRSAALDRHSADNNCTGREAGEAKADDDLRGQAQCREGVARGAVEGDEGDTEDQQGRRSGREVAAQAQQQGGLLRRGIGCGAGPAALKVLLLECLNEGMMSRASRSITQREGGEKAGEDDERGRQVERSVQAVAERGVGRALNLGYEAALA